MDADGPPASCPGAGVVCEDAPANSGKGAASRNFLSWKCIHDHWRQKVKEKAHGKRSSHGLFEYCQEISLFISRQHVGAQEKSIHQNLICYLVSDRVREDILCISASWRMAACLLKISTTDISKLAFFLLNSCTRLVWLCYKQLVPISRMPLWQVQLFLSIQL